MRAVVSDWMLDKSGKHAPNQSDMYKALTTATLGTRELRFREPLAEKYQEFLRAMDLFLPNVFIGEPLDEDLIVRVGNVIVK
jgi:hypothetical protein